MPHGSNGTKVTGMSKLSKLLLFAALSAGVILGAAGMASMSGLHLTPQRSTPPSVSADPEPSESEIPASEFRQQYSEDGGTALIFEIDDEEATGGPEPC